MKNYSFSRHVYIYIYIYVYLYTHIYIYLSIYLREFVYTYMYIYIYMEAVLSEEQLFEASLLGLQRGGGTGHRPAARPPGRPLARPPVCGRPADRPAFVISTFGHSCISGLGLSHVIRVFWRYHMDLISRILVIGPSLFIYTYMYIYICPPQA